jgi:hypothetical protein
MVIVHHGVSKRGLFGRRQRHLFLPDDFADDAAHPPAHRIVIHLVECGQVEFVDQLCVHTKFGVEKIEASRLRLGAGKRR